MFNAVEMMRTLMMIKRKPRRAQPAPPFDGCSTLPDPSYQDSVHVRVELTAAVHVHVEVPENMTDAQLKGYIWENHKDEILAGMTMAIHKKEEQSQSSSTIHTDEDEKAEKEVEVEDKECKAVNQEDSVVKVPPQVQDQVHVKVPPPACCGAIFPDESKAIYGALLAGLLDVTKSEFGFIGETKYEEDGTVYLELYAAPNQNILVTEDTRKFISGPQLVRLYDMDTLFGR
jgi:hypothetical protein